MDQSYRLPVSVPSGPDESVKGPNELPPKSATIGALLANATGVQLPLLVPANRTAIGVMLVMTTIPVEPRCEAPQLPNR